MIIPDKIEISLQDKHGKSLKIPNVFFGLKIFTSSNEYHNFSIMATDSNGEIILTKSEILENTEIETNDLSDEPTPFEFYIWEQNQLQLFVNRLELLLNQYKNEDAIKNELRTFGIEESNIESELKKVQEKEKEDKLLFERLSKSQNNNLILFKDKISGKWETAEKKTYNLIVKRKTTSNNGEHP